MFPTTTPDMDMMKLVSEYGDDLYALALCVTKDPAAASEVFIKTLLSVKDTEPQLADIAAAAFPFIRDAECNEEAQTLTEVSLNQKQEALLGEVFAKPQILRAIIHMSYENDLTPVQIAKATGESERFVFSQLEQLSEPLAEALEQHYKEICLKISADDKLKQYAVRAAQSGPESAFTVSEEAHPIHCWSRKQKIIVIIIAALITFVVCIVIPILQGYKEMREKEKEDGISFDDSSSDISFYIPVDSKE